MDTFLATSPVDKNEKLDYILEYLYTFKDSLNIRKNYGKNRINY